MTFKHDVARTGLNPTETVLTPSNVNSTTFGLLTNILVDSAVDAQPLYLSHLNVGGAHNVVYVVTEADSVYAFDADTFTQLWHASLIPSGSNETPSDQVDGCGQVAPTIGITSTPVIDRSAGPNGTLFAVAMTKDSAGNYHQRIYGLDVATGAVLLGPTEISATYPGSGASPFDPKQYEERAALLLSQGVIYTSWTSHCDVGPYSGWVIGYDETTLMQKSVLNLAPNSTTGPAIWMAGSGPAVDASGNIYLLTANGAFDTILDGSGFPSGQDYGNSFVKISTGGGMLTVVDYFAMSNELAESAGDTDLGSGGAMLLPDLTDTSGVRHLIVGAGKDGAIYLVDRDNMGKYDANANHIQQELLNVGTGCFASPAYFNGTVYYPEVGYPIMAFAVNNALLSTSPTSVTPESFGWPGGSPAVSANGTTNGIVWVVESVYTNGSPSAAVLHAFDASNLANELYNSNQASGGHDQFGVDAKFITPAIADGKVFVGTPNSVAIFGLLQPVAAASARRR